MKIDKTKEDKKLVSPRPMDTRTISRSLPPPSPLGPPSLPALAYVPPGTLALFWLQGWWTQIDRLSGLGFWGLSEMRQEGEDVGCLGFRV